MIHYAHPDLLRGPARVALIGCGGNGSQMLTRIARLNHAMRALGHPGMQLTVYDPDEVSEANCGRQMFAPADVGQNKAVLSVTRINAWFGTAWEAEAGIAPATGPSDDPHMVICCVDSAAARAEISRFGWVRAARYVLDLGNRGADGQAVLGQGDRHLHTPDELDPDGEDEDVAPPPRGRKKKLLVDHADLPYPYTLLPELTRGGSKDDAAPSCSLAEALQRQELFVNDAVTTQASAILWELFRHARLSWHGAFVNLRTGRASPIPVDPAVWDRMQQAAPAPSTRRTTKPARRNRK